MVSGLVSTVFSPDPACVTSSNLWLLTSACMSLPYNNGPDVSCTYVFHGEQRTTSAPDSCYAAYPSTVAYTDCPESYTLAYVQTFRSQAYDDVWTYCCPEAYYYDWDADPFTSTINGEVARVTLRNQPRCKATSIEVLRSQIVTITVAKEPEIATTTTDWADDAILFAEAQTIFATVYSTPTLSTCWGHNCPSSYEPTPTFPATITPTPTVQFVPPSECLDPANIWIVTTSCYIESPTYGSAPDWLQCAVTNFGAPDWYDPTCFLPTEPKTTQGADVLYYDGCPSGYGAVSSMSGPGYDTYRYDVGYFDISYYSTACCPTEYGFGKAPWNAGQSITTVHDDITYGVHVYPPPGCYATSVSGLSGKDVPMRTTSNSMAWDKRQEAFPTTTSWDYQAGTLFAHEVNVGYTVFMGTHTCYESCSTWLTYYYPDGTGGSTPSTGVATVTSTSGVAAGTTAATGTDPGSGTVVGETDSGTAANSPATITSKAAGRYHDWSWCNLIYPLVGVILLHQPSLAGYAS
ncbi:hypothetical protein BJ170DRAFT_680486 [Xylariales sp. AK1849]|nr:hypothetical protein BJ170DRAFT_680486 [Xylariales sp. AK1849]